MPTDPHGPGRPPSAAARAQLVADLRREVADGRLRLEEATLRAEAHRLLGDAEGVRAALVDHDRVVGELRVGLARAVSAGVVQRDAEEVLAGAALGEVDPDGPVGADPFGATGAVTTPAGARVPVRSRVAAALAVVALAAAAVTGVVRGPDRLAVLDATDTRDTPATTRPEPEPEAPAAPTAPAPAEADRRRVDAEPPPAVGTGSEAGTDRRTRTVEQPAAAEPATRPSEPVDAGADEARSVVEDLLDAVAGLGPDTDADAPTELAEVVERLGELVPGPDDLPDLGGGGGGFVPAPSGQ